MTVLQPPGWPRPKGFAQGIAAEGRYAVIAGQVGWNPVTERFETDEFAGQVRQALANIVAVLAAAGGRAEHIVRLTWFVTEKSEYLGDLKGVGEAYRAVLGRHYPAMTLVEIGGLVEDRAKVEIEATAVLPKA